MRVGGMMVAGGGGANIKQGKHFAYKEDVTPLRDLWLSTLRHFGIRADSFGDSRHLTDEIFGA